MDRRIVIVNVLIHGFTVMAAMSAAGLAQTMLGDEAVISTLTVAMIVGISRVYDRPFGVGEALALLGTFAGFYFGTRVVMMLVKWIPGIGNMVNAVATSIVTEILGWVGFLVVKEGRQPSEIHKRDAKDIWRRAKSMRKEMRQEQAKIKTAVKAMSHADKQHYDQLMERLKDKHLPKEEFDGIGSELDQLLARYGV